MDANRFDTLARSMTDVRSRRGALATLLGGTLGLRGLAEMAAKNGKNGKGGGKKGNGGGKNGNGGGKKGKGNGNNKGNGNGNNKGKGNGSGSGNGRPARCGQGICALEFIGDEVDRCEEKCGRCRVDGQFCVIAGDPIDPAKVATCCFEDQQCCQGTFACCDKTATCCGGYPEFNRTCCPQFQYCCDSDENGCCFDDEACCPGAGCKSLKSDASNCGFCGNSCGPGEVCRNGSCLCEGPHCVCQRCVGPGLECCPGPECIFTGGQDRNNCGGCGRTCPTGQRCIDGQCGCGAGYKYCPLAERCVEERAECCGGLPIGYCFPPFPCCGTGVNAYCSTTLTCP